jgi:hypothetical protein
MGFCSAIASLAEVAVLSSADRTSMSDRRKKPPTANMAIVSIMARANVFRMLKQRCRGSAAPIVRSSSMLGWRRVLNN